MNAQAKMEVLWFPSIVLDFRYGNEDWHYHMAYIALLDLGNADADVETTLLVVTV